MRPKQHKIAEITCPVKRGGATCTLPKSTMREEKWMNKKKVKKTRGVFSETRCIRCRIFYKIDVTIVTTRSTYQLRYHLRNVLLILV